MISMEEQKKIAIEMWQYIKSLIEQHEPMFSITGTKKKWLKNNYPDIHWKNSCLLCDVYTHLHIYDDGSYTFVCPDCPLSKKYKDSASYGCSRHEDTPWARIVDYEEDIDAAVKACDEIIAVIKSYL